MTNAITDSAESDAGRIGGGGIWLIGAAILLAWFPILKGYPLVADEYTFRALGEGGLAGVVRLVKDMGIWRSLGMPIQAVAAMHPAVVPWVAIVMHVAVCLLLFRLVQLFGADHGIARVAALLFGVFPFGYQCLVNTMCIPMMLTTGLLLGWMWLLMEEPSRCGPAAMACLGAAVGFVSGCVYESLVFCFAASGIVAFLVRHELDVRRPGLRGHIWAAVGAMVGAGLYLALYRLVPGPARPLSPVFNPESLLGAWWWQWSNVWVFEPWLLGKARSLMFYDWGWGQAVIAAALGAVVIVLAARLRGPEASAVPWSGRRKWAGWAGIVLLLLSASLVFVFVGYSTDTRKKYCLLPLGLLAGCRLLAEFPRAAGVIRGRIAAISAGLVAMGVATTWLILGVYRFEITRYEALLAYLRGAGSPSRVELCSDGSTDAPWPRMPYTLGAGFFEGWVLGEGLQPPLRAPLDVSFGPNGVRYDPATRTWAAQ
ncbi:MAG TPA: hypothetical protein PLU30_23150 [Verrucomicrobiae bacterium]|nr:hypothetical protein [Verrucomicrobiae bacterium]